MAWLLKSNDMIFEVWGDSVLLPSNLGRLWNAVISVRMKPGFLPSLLGLDPWAHAASTLTFKVTYDDHSLSHILIAIMVSFQVFADKSVYILTFPRFKDITESLSRQQSRIIRHTNHLMDQSTSQPSSSSPYMSNSVY